MRPGVSESPALETTLGRAGMQEGSDVRNLALNEAIQKAEQTPGMDLASMFTDVFQEMPWNLKEQYEDLKRIKKEYE